MSVWVVGGEVEWGERERGGWSERWWRGKRGVGCEGLGVWEREG